MGEKTSEDSIDTPETDPFEEVLFGGYTEAEISEMEILMKKWDKATYPTLANSIVDHANRHDFADDYLRYLRKAANFNKRGASQKLLPNNTIRWNKGLEFLIERNGRIISYGEN